MAYGRPPFPIDALGDELGLEDVELRLQLVDRARAQLRGFFDGGVVRLVRDGQIPAAEYRLDGARIFKSFKCGSGGVLPVCNALEFVDVELR